MTGDDELHRIIASVKVPLNVDGATFSGPGWDLIQKEVVSAQLIAVGEDHFTREVPEFISALCDALGPKSLAAMAIEAGPEVARFMQKRLSTDRLAQDMTDLTDRYPDSVAFFNMAEENDLLTHCARVSGRPDFEIWGLDQEFKTPRWRRRAAIPSNCSSSAFRTRPWRRQKSFSLKVAASAVGSSLRPS
jgi:hypothetical protein